jgi:hypothetical protein
MAAVLTAKHSRNTSTDQQCQMISLNFKFKKKQIVRSESDLNISSPWADARRATMNSDKFVDRKSNISTGVANFPGKDKSPVQNLTYNSK